MTNIKRNRETGTLIEIGHQDTFGIENDEYVWLTYCINHGNLIGHETKKLAIQWSSKPSVWCESCAKKIN